MRLTDPLLPILCGLYVVTLLKVVFNDAIWNGI